MEINYRVEKKEDKRLFLAALQDVVKELMLGHKVSCKIFITQ